MTAPVVDSTWPSGSSRRCILMLCFDEESVGRWCLRSDGEMARAQACVRAWPRRLHVSSSRGDTAGRGLGTWHCCPRSCVQQGRGLARQNKLEKFITGTCYQLVSTKRSLQPASAFPNFPKGNEGTWPELCDVVLALEEDIAVRACA